MYCRSGVTSLVLPGDQLACAAQLLGDSLACSPCRPQLLQARADLRLAVCCFGFLRPALPPWHVWGRCVHSLYTVQASEDLCLRVWDCRSMSVAQSLTGQSDIPLCCDCSPDGESTCRTGQAPGQQSGASEEGACMQVYTLLQPAMGLMVMAARCASGTGGSSRCWQGEVQESSLSPVCTRTPISKAFPVQMSGAQPGSHMLQLPAPSTCFTE